MWKINFKATDPQGDRDLQKGLDLPFRRGLYQKRRKAFDSDMSEKLQRYISRAMYIYELTGKYM